MRIFNLTIALTIVLAAVVSAESPVTIRPPNATYCLQRDPMVFVINSTYDKPLEGSCRIERLSADDKWEAAFSDSGDEVQNSCFRNFELPPSRETRCIWPVDKRPADQQVLVLRLSCRFRDLQIVTAEELAAYERKLHMLEKQIKELEELGDDVDVDSLRNDLGEALRTDGSSEANISPTPTPEPTPTPTPIPGEPPFQVYSASFQVVLCK